MTFSPTHEAQAASKAGDQATAQAWLKYSLGTGPKPTKSYSEPAKTPGTTAVGSYVPGKGYLMADGNYSPNPPDPNFSLGPKTESPPPPPPPPVEPADPNALPVQPGLDWLQVQEGFALQKYIAELTARGEESTKQLQKDLAQIDAASRAESDARNAALQRELQAGRITADKYLQQKDLAARESEFARTFALQNRQQQHQEEMDQLSGELAKAQEIRLERSLQAELASNPSDYTKYEFYKRQLGQPQVQGQGAQSAQGGAGAQEVGGVLNGFMGDTQQSGADGTVDTTGASYTPGQAAYSDKTLQTVLASIFGGNKAGYNPNIQGTGAFGAQIESPNSLSRSEFGSLDQSDIEILGSFLKAGVQTDPNDPNSRVSIDPQDYFKQMQASWIPTMQQTQTSYGQ